MTGRRPTSRGFRAAPALARGRHAAGRASAAHDRSSRPLPVPPGAGPGSNSFPPPVQRPVTAQALGEPSTGPAWKTIPSWYLVTGKDHAIPPAAQRPMAARAHAHTVEVAGPHDMAVTDPHAVTRVVERAATAR
ncbi:alpha/beta hydrolase [Streptomyces sp. NPDC101237]|uniref:alpha/beta hydrolase n=1 Tax=Streptomyces sp. NPDC101237 TaxID=3366139 RepID=UPI0038037EEC